MSRFSMMRLKPVRSLDRLSSLIKRDPWLLLILVFGLLTYSVFTIFAVATDRPIDYYWYVAAAHSFSQGKNFYLISPKEFERVLTELGIPGFENVEITLSYPYSTLTAMVVWPLTFLPLRFGAAIWIFSSSVATLASGWLLSAHTSVAWKRYLTLIATILFTPVLASLSLGQVNAYVLLFTVGALHFWRKQREGIAGTLLGVALWLKPLSLALLYLTAQRRKWGAVWGLVVTSTAVSLASFMLFGLEVSLSQLEQALPALTEGYPSSLAGPHIQSLLGLLVSLFSPTQYGLAPLNAPQLILPTFFLLASALFLSSLLLLRPGSRSGQPIELQASLLISATLLILPVTEFHHLMMMVIAFAALISCLPDSRRISLSLAALTIPYLFFEIQGLFLAILNVKNPILPVGPSIAGLIAQQTSILDFGTWACLMVWILVAVQLRKFQ